MPRKRKTPDRPAVIADPFGDTDLDEEDASPIPDDDGWVALRADEEKETTTDGEVKGKRRRRKPAE